MKEEVIEIDVKDNYILAVWIEAYYIPEENKYYISSTPCPMFYQK